MSTNEELAMEIQRGRVEYLADLWEQVERFVWKQAKRWAGAWPKAEAEDLSQAGFLALYGACETYQPERGKFLTWYGLYLKTAFSEAVGGHTERQRRDPLQKAVSLDIPLSDDDPEGATIGDTVAGPDLIADTERRVYLEQLRDTLERALSGLPLEEGEAMRLRHGEGLTVEQTAQRMGADNAAVRRWERHALRDLSKPAVTRELSQFLDERTNFYGARGVHAVEEVALYRERMREQLKP